MPYNFLIPNGDTDSISFCKPGGENLSPEEIKVLVKEINSASPEFMEWEDDGFYKTVVVLKAKNYMMLAPNGKIVIKGSATKDAKKEPALKEFIAEVIDSLLYGKDNLVEIYQRYCNEARHITDISRWAVKKSISKKLLDSDRKQETDVIEAIGDKINNYREGDKVYLYNTYPKFIPELDDEGNEVLNKSGKNKGKPKGKFVKVLKTIDNWQNDYDIDHYVDRVYATLSIFSTVIDMEKFKNLD